MMVVVSVGISQLFGRKPKNKNLLVGRPAAESAAMAAEGPGIGTTLNPPARAALTILNPGSEINGVPASLTKAMSDTDKVPSILGIIWASFQSRIEI